MQVYIKASSAISNTNKEESGDCEEDEGYNYFIDFAFSHC